MAQTNIRPAGYSPADFGKVISISRSGVYNLIKDGTIRAVKIGQRTVIPATEVDRLLNVEDDGE